jgi:SAM-dependent methyltransferase
MAYRYTKLAKVRANTTSTPEAWEANFASARPFTSWTAFRLSVTREWSLIRRFVPKGSRIADMGSGAGWWVRFLALRGYEAIGCDYAPALIRSSQALYPDSTWIETRIQDVPLPDASLDAIISWGVIEHDEAGPSAALNEFHRVLAPGGHIVVTVPIDTPAARAAHDVFETGEGHESFFQYLMTEDELRKYVADAGFEIRESGSMPAAHINHVAPRLAQRLRGIAYRVALLGSLLLLSWMKRYRVMIYVVARKP